MRDAEFEAFMRECQDQNKLETAEAKQSLKESRRKTASPLKRQSALVSPPSSRDERDRPAATDSL